MGLCGIRLFGWVLFGVCLSSAVARPKHTNAVQKDLYTRQILPAVPGYIPVYIQHGEEPPAWKSSSVKQKAKIKTQIQKGGERKEGETVVKRKKHDKIHNSDRSAEYVKFPAKQRERRSSSQNRYR